jgi:hypothetical protein
LESMKWSLLRPLAPYLWTLLPAYAFERVAEYYFLAKSPTFYLFSGWRLEIFIVAALVGSIAAGALLKDLKLVIATQSAAIATLFATVYVVCNPEVCYSAGPDGFEPLRFGLFLGAVAASGGTLGVMMRGENPNHGWRGVLVAGGAFFALSYYPVIYTFAGARLLSPLDPWGADSVLFVLAFATSMTTTQLGRRTSFVVTLAAFLLVIAAAFGIALQYLGSLDLQVTLMSAAVVAGAALGTLGIRGASRSKRVVPWLYAVSVIMVLLMTVVVIPDAVSGVYPAVPTGGAPTIGAPVYAGAYQNGPQGHATGAMVTVSFSGTNPDLIQGKNYLSAGIGIHSAGCCVDGIDYAYRFDVVLLPGGSEALLATGWEACDDIAACGGHSWKVLLFSHEDGLSDPGANVTLAMVWSGGSIDWLYATDGGGLGNFTSYTVPGPENHDFNTGVSSGEGRAAYFYQFGVMSRHPVGQSGWLVTMTCPSLLMGATWGCVDHANSVSGTESYWKVIWRWGENYPQVSVTSPQPQTVVFQYTTLSATESFQVLW